MEQIEQNILTLTDSYKASHWRQYPAGTERVFSYFESRLGARWHETVFFGLRYFIRQYLVGQVVTQRFINEADRLFAAHFGGAGVFNKEGWQRLLEKHDGRLPVRIHAAPEGTVVPVGNALMTIENTDPEFPWLTNYLETLLVQVWYPCTVATQSREMKRTILRYLEETGDPAGIGFKLHDFGFRGVSSVESAGLGAAAHLVNFMGTDTVRGLELLAAVYGAPMAGFSIPASEHSTMTSWGREHELDACRNMLVQHPTGAIACVSDSWDIIECCREIWGGALREMVLDREGTLVVRPDSGDPLKVVPEVIRILGERIGQKKNEKGFFVLDPHVRVIQGDGIDADSIEGILEAVKQAGYSADNLAFGSGGGLLQKLNRDTQRFAFKCSAIEINGQWQGVQKRPASDLSKSSKAGRLQLWRNEAGEFTTAEEASGEGWAAHLELVFEDGHSVQDWRRSDSFEAIRLRAGL